MCESTPCVTLAPMRYLLTQTPACSQQAHI
jgi:hypothetical protein